MKELNFGPCGILPWRINPPYSGFEETLCYFAALLRVGGGGAIMNEKC